MSYEKQTWQTGDIITAEKLNHMEDGITSAQVYSVSEDVRFSGSVTTAENHGSYTANIDCDLSDLPEQIKVRFDGTEYTCEKTISGPAVGYGGVGAPIPDFSEYPFAINIANAVTILTETASTHQVEITAVVKLPNEDITDLLPIMQLIDGVTNSTDAVGAFNAGKLLYFTYQDGFYIGTNLRFGKRY